MKKLVIGILAHVDAGKTTLSEGILYLSGKTGKLGRVDNKDAFFDTHDLEKSRGITIFSKQAIIEIDDIQITLMDTPGHIDFSTEMERTLQVLDYAVLVVNGSDGVQGHTKTLWRLLILYKIPVFIFVNKMDQCKAERDKLLKDMEIHLNEGCIDFGQADKDGFYDQLAMCDEIIMDTYLEEGSIKHLQIARAIKELKVFPCFFGAALKLNGIEQLIKGIMKYTIIPSYPDEFGAKIFKITRDEQGNRLTHIKLTGGKIKVKDVLEIGNEKEKINQIRIYSGNKFETVNELEAGSICALIGLNQTVSGECLGSEKSSHTTVLEPVLSYRIIFPEGCNKRIMFSQLKQLEEEDPELHIVWNEQIQEMQIQIMGEVQIEILQSLIQNRFHVNVTFGEGRIVYKETIRNVVEGVGHFEPLRHYAEVHLLLEPGESGSGLRFETDCNEDVLGKSWQRLILTHLKEKPHKGVLTGALITDMKITVVSGKSHNKHTEGGDFRQATYRAVRQGLKEAESVLLEPYYSFQLELPEKMIGRAMSDIEKMNGKYEISQSNTEMAIIVGSAPVITMKNYQKEVVAYTKGLGKLFCTLKGYEPCHNEEEIINNIGYDSERDIENPTGSVFCSHGEGFLVNWDKVKEYMHVKSYLKSKEDLSENKDSNQVFSKESSRISLDEIDKIINQTFYANQGKKMVWNKQKSVRNRYFKTGSHDSNNRRDTTQSDHHIVKRSAARKEYLLVDGYNIIYAWPELKKLSEEDMDGARIKLLDSLCNYQGIRNCRIIVVFDAYRVRGRREEENNYHNIHIVFTKEAQTADQYIEKFAYENNKKYKIVVATSDGLEQVMVRGMGCFLLSARELKIEIERANKSIQQDYLM